MQLNDCLVAIFQQDSVKWFANINNAAPEIMKELKDKLALNQQEELLSTD